MKRWGVGVVLLALAALPAVAGARTQVVYAGGQPAFQQKLVTRYSGEVLSFFPETVTIHVGDTIAWKGMSIGFHTIDLPGPSGRALPLIVPRGGTASGFNDFAGMPFWFNGLVPNLGFNPALFAPIGGHIYNGSARVDAGLPFKPGTFKIKFTKAGRYAYQCDVHPGMHGLVVVLPKSKKLPSAAQIAAGVATQQAHDLKVAAKLVHTKIKGDRVSLGMKGKNNVEILAMFQGVTHVKVGTVVTFAMSAGSFETHTATFGPLSYLTPLVNSFDQPGPFDPRALFPSSPPPAGPIVLNQTSHGNAFANTGALADHKGAKASGLSPLEKIKFTQKGTYRFQCLIHPFMHGVVIVQ